MVTNSFNDYARVYDSFYIEKDYETEYKNLIQIAKEFTSKIDNGLEIGAGSGSFTSKLAKTLKRVEAYELSPSMVEICKNKLMNYGNVVVNEGDLIKILKSKIPKIL